MILAAAVAVFVYFHAPNGELVIIERGSDAPLIIRPSPPGYAPGTLIETGSGVAIVTESVCTVKRKLERPCKKESK
jgi:hypothetical protein